VTTLQNVIAYVVLLILARFTLTSCCRKRLMTGCVTGYDQITSINWWMYP